MNQTEKEKEADQARLASLVQTKENIAKMGDYEANLKELCTRIVPDIDNYTSQDKRMPTPTWTRELQLRRNV